MTRTRRLLLVAAFGVATWSVGASGEGQEAARATGGGPPRGAGQVAGRQTAELDVLRVRDDVYMIAGAGGNVTLQFGPQGAFLVDSGSAGHASDLLSALKRLTSEPVRYIVNTSVDGDHVGGNPLIGKSGSAIPARELRDQSAVMVAHENVLNRMSAPTGQQAPAPSDAWPTATYFVPRKDLFFNEQGIEIRHVPAGHSDGDSMVFFRRSDVLSAGDVFNMNTYPVIDVGKGGSITGTIEALNTLLDLAIAGEKEEAGTIIVPGHGRLADEADLAEYRDMMTIIRDRIEDMRMRGLTLAQVKAARPTVDFDPRFGSTSGEWTTEAFVEAVYTSLGSSR